MNGQSHSHLHTPQTPAPANPQRITYRRPTQITNLILTCPRRTRSSLPTTRLLLAWGLRHHCSSLTHQIPNQDRTVITATGEHAPPIRTPLDAIHSCTVAVELEEGLPRLADVQDSDEGRVGGDGGKEVGVVRGGGNTEERRWEGKVGTRWSLATRSGRRVGTGGVQGC